MFRSGLVAIFLISAIPAVAQPSAPATATASPATPAPAPAPTPQQQAVRDAAMAYNGCVRAGIGGVPSSVAPQQAADTIIAGCMAQQRALEIAANAYIAMLPAAEQTEKREEVRTGFASVATQIATAITQMRAAPPVAPLAPAPHN